MTQQHETGHSHFLGGSSEKPPHSIPIGKLRLAIWDTSFWTFLVKFGHKGLFLSFLPSATKLWQGNVFTPVCQSFCSQGGVCLNACWDTPPAGTPLAGTPPGQAHPWAGTPPWAGTLTSRYTLTCTPPGQVYPLDRYTLCSRWYTYYWNSFLLKYVTF